MKIKMKNNFTLDISINRRKSGKTTIVGTHHITCITSV